LKEVVEMGLANGGHLQLMEIGMKENIKKIENQGKESTFGLIDVVLMDNS
jgi:hypothetical protein